MMDYPDLSRASAISLDLETNDPAIGEGMGSGALRGGYIAGIALGTPDGYREYFPVAHEQGPNLDRETVFRYVRNQLSRPEQPKIGANLLYDLEYLWVAGIKVAGPCYDVQLAEPLLNEKSFSYALELLAQQYLGEGKVSDIYAWLAQRFGGKPTREGQAGNIWRAPGHIIAPYAKGDVDLPLRIFEKQRVELEKQDLWDLFLLETELIPMLLAMKMRGVRVDVKKAEEVACDLDRKVAAAQAELGPYNVNASRSLATLWDKLGIWYPRTVKTGAPSFTKDTLAACQHPVARLVESIKQTTKLRDTFVRKMVLGWNINGRIHCQFNQLRSDEYGTVSGRFSSSNPNLQQVPAKGDNGVLVRSMFLPDDGDEWVSIDYSQIEYRCFAHYAEDETIIAAYADPHTDFHEQVSKILGSLLDRKIVKTFNFGILYGAGFRKIATMLRTNIGMDQISALFEGLGDITNPDKFTKSCLYILKSDPQFKPDVYDLTAWRVLEVYDEKFPAAKKLMNRVANTAKNRGYIRTILKRRRRFEGESTHKALNALLQGSAADIMKKGMVDIWKSGVCDILGAPLLTVHDELDFSVPKTYIGNEAIMEANRLMQAAIPLRIPVMTDLERGPNWGEIE